MKRHLRSLIFILLISLGLFAAGCKVGVDEVREIEDPIAAPTGRVISGEEALRFYGIEPGVEVGPVEPSSTQEPWFPMQVWVSASILLRIPTMLDTSSRRWRSPDPIDVDHKYRAMSIT